MAKSSYNSPSPSYSVYRKRNKWNGTPVTEDDEDFDIDALGLDEIFPDEDQFKEFAGDEFDNDDDDAAFYRRPRVASFRPGFPRRAR